MHVINLCSVAIGASGVQQAYEIPLASRCKLCLILFARFLACAASPLVAGNLHHAGGGGKHECAAVPFARKPRALMPSKKEKRTDSTANGSSTGHSLYEVCHASDDQRLVHVQYQHGVMHPRQTAPFESAPAPAS